MPGTTADGNIVRLSLQQQLAEARAENKRLRDREADWSRQQIAHEERGRSFILINNEKKSAEQKLDAAHAQRETLRERLETRTSELRELQSRHKELEDVTLRSEDDKVAEIARLSKALAEAEQSAKNALASKKSAEDSFDYVKEQYRLTQDAATSLRAELSTLQARIPTLEKQASGEVNKLKQIHYERQQKLNDEIAERNKSKIKMLEALNARQAEEIAKLKMGRGSGVGTRQMTGGSRPGSRAASPALGHRDRVANLRNG
jgi:chromosome segregation ATPase